MYIEDRLYSENTEEVLYSVALDEEEYYLYSEFQKEFGKIHKAGAVVKPSKELLELIEKGKKNPVNVGIFRKKKPIEPMKILIEPELNRLPKKELLVI